MGKMQIRPQEIAYRTEIGTLDGSPVTEIGLKGGLHLIVSKRGPKINYLGVGPHRAVARFMAKKSRPDIQITALEKSEDAPVSAFEHLLPEYESLRARLNAGKSRK